MFPKTQRFTKEDFSGVRLKVFFRGILLDIAYCTLPTQKYACVISKKTLKTAVQRNLVKRRIMNGLQTCTIPEGKSFVFYPKKTSYTAEYSLLIEEIQQAFATLP
jgi:ribonuclease P protein component